MTTTAADTSGEAWASGARGSGTAAARAQLARLFDEHGRLVLGVCRTLLRNSHDAEDAAQQTFLSAYRSLLGGGVPRQPDAWLATIARNECRGRMRQRMREPLPEAELEGESPDPVPGMIRSKALWDAVSGLPSQQRRALLLREFGLSYEELATALAVSEPAIESLLFRARYHLRSALASVNGAFSLGAIRELLVRAAGPGAATSQAAAKIAALPLVAKVAAGAATVALVAGGTVAVSPQLSGHHRAVARAAPAKTPVRSVAPTRAIPRQLVVAVQRVRAPVIVPKARPRVRLVPARTVPIHVATPTRYSRPAVSAPAITPDPAPSQPAPTPAPGPAPTPAPTPEPAAPAAAPTDPPGSVLAVPATTPAAVVATPESPAAPTPADTRTIAHHDDPAATPPADTSTEPDPAAPAPPPATEPDEPDVPDPAPPPHDPLHPGDPAPPGP